MPTVSPKNLILDGIDSVVTIGISSTIAKLLQGNIDSNDTVTYIKATSRVAVSLFQGVGWEGAAKGVGFSSIENLTGSAFDDFLVGDDRANVLDGGAGNDTLQGLGGSELAIVGVTTAGLNTIL
jgi:Ca2+-binding RTX toxin-like protein